MKNKVKGPTPLDQKGQTRLKNIGKDPAEYKTEYQIGPRTVYFNQRNGERICFCENYWASSKGETGLC